MSVIQRVVPAATALAATVAVAGLAMAPPAGAAAHSPSSFIEQFGSYRNVASTVPGNGDVNPYGIVVLRHSHGRLHRGDVLISNFNNKANLQGTGTTIVEISPGGHRTLFARIDASQLPGSCPGGVGLTTALVVLRGRWVVVGSTPSANGRARTSGRGCLIVLNSRGKVRETISGQGINGPWDAAALLEGRYAKLFVTNILNGTVAAHFGTVHRGTVLRLLLRVFIDRPPQLRSVTKVGSKFAERANVGAFVLGPTGVALGRNGTLYVANTDRNEITAIPRAATRHTSAGNGRVVTSGGKLNAPLGLAIAPGGDILTVNGNNGLVVETTPGGTQVAWRYLDRHGRPLGAGALFGLAVGLHGSRIYYVDDAINKLRVLS
jgi:hypothetical protein